MWRCESTSLPVVEPALLQVLGGARQALLRTAKERGPLPFVWSGFIASATQARRNRASRPSAKSLRIGLCLCVRYPGQPLQ